MARPKIIRLNKEGKVSHGGFDIYPNGNAVWSAKVGELPHDPQFRGQYSQQTEYTGSISHANRSGREVTKAANITQAAMAMAAPAITGGSLAATLFGRGSRGKLRASRIGAAVGAAIGAAGVAFEAHQRSRRRKMYNRWASQGVIAAPQSQAVMKGFANELSRIS
jgi:uncharacterized membrane protein YebE (DUF533 family)